MQFCPLLNQKLTCLFIAQTQRKSVVSAQTDPKKMQLHAPNTVPHVKLLQNSYISELNLSQISSLIDIEMAVNLGLPQKRKKTLQDEQNAPSKTEVKEQEAKEHEAKEQQDDTKKENEDDGQEEKDELDAHAQDETAYSLNLNCQYDFRPANFNFLMLSRFSFSQKKRRIQKMVRKKMQEKKNLLKRSLA